MKGLCNKAPYSHKLNPAEFKPSIVWSEVGSANLSTTQIQWNGEQFSSSIRGTDILSRDAMSKLFYLPSEKDLL